MLAGDKSVQLSRFVVSGQQREVICTDPKVLEYIGERFRRHIQCPEGHANGWSYLVILEFQNGGYTDLWGTFNNNIYDTHVNVPADVGWPTHYIEFPVPMPEGMKRILEFIDLPHPNTRKLVVD